jgi:hypothetical protein
VLVLPQVGVYLKMLGLLRPVTTVTAEPEPVAGGGAASVLVQLSEEQV